MSETAYTLDQSELGGEDELRQPPPWPVLLILLGMFWLAVRKNRRFK